MLEPTDRERLSLLERSQDNLARAQQLHADTLAQHAVWHREHREAMARLDAQHQTLLDLLATSEQRLAASEARLTGHAEHMARLDVLLQAIKELLERGHNGH